MLGQLQKRSAVDQQAAYDAVRAQATADQMVCGALKEDGSPVYFLMPRTAEPAEIEAEVFKIRHGREQTEAEFLLGAMIRVRTK